ncbi:hypothetical protein RD792_009571 [Penstemon davidsonii]|uniref:Multidrug resistance protein NorM n=1 Tax=Penstemon davidsonii TaxID=160366 RepID=A0ABR0CZE5_9LAMI|nr:hypothetical protein RD792_009571 [Penstemon davidsonii]
MGSFEVQPNLVHFYAACVRILLNISVFLGLVLKLDELGLEIARIALPAALALTADPIASLVDTIFIGQIGPIELAAVGVSIALFNQVSRIAIFPLVSVTTSFVAEEDTCTKVSSDSESLENGSTLDSEDKMLIPQNDLDEKMYKSESDSISFEIAKTEQDKRHIPSASSALIIGGILGLIQAFFLIFAAKPLLGFMGVKSDSQMLYPAQQYLKLRSLGAPAVLLSLAMQGVFRGFKDTKTPLYATAVTFCVTLAASMAARLGSTQMAAFQVCLQVWLATSLLADGLAVAGQAILASAFARNDHSCAAATACRVLQLGLILGLVLAMILGLGLHFGARIFTKDVDVLHLIGVGIPFVAASQPINALAFVFDGVNFGASDFAYSAYSMVMVAILSIIVLFILSSTSGFVGIWIALTIYMSLRAFAGFWRWNRDWNWTLGVS